MRARLLVGWGISIYAIIYLAWQGLALYGLLGGWPGRVLLLMILLGIVSIAAESLHLRSYREMLPYSFGWLAIVLVFDAVFIVPLSGWSVYTDPNAWVGYALVFFVPLFIPHLKPGPRSPEPLIS